MASRPDRSARFLIAAVCIVLAAGLAGAGSQARAEQAGGATALSELRRGSEALADLAEGLIDAVVNISTSQTVDTGRSIPVPELPEGSPYKKFFDDFFERQRRGGQPRKVRSLGSGFVVDEAGIIVTNSHVIADADEIVVNFSDGTELDAEVIGRDGTTDLAVLRVKPDRPLTAVRFGDSDKIRVGNWVMAIGNPFGLGGTVTVGIVSARNRDIKAGPYDDFIQTDAAINRGNSGGPLFNLEGEVVGINTAIFSPTGGSIGIGFAVPANMAAPVVEQLIANGEVRRGWLGVRIQEVDDEPDGNRKAERSRGALVLSVNPDGPAAAAGIQAGDVVVRFDGIEIPQMRDLSRVVAATVPGREVEVTVLRDGGKKTVRVKVGLLEDRTASGEGGAPGKEPAQDNANVLGLALAPMSEELRTRYNIAAAVDGVVVTDVDPDSSAAERGIAPGSVIVKVGHDEVRTPGEVIARIEAVRRQGRDWVVLALADASGELRFVAVKNGE